MSRARYPRPYEIAAAARDPRLLAARAARPDPGWRERGACRSVDAEAFFTLPKEYPAVALAACGRCEVAASCLRWALEVGEQEGVIGNTQSTERRAMLVAWRNRTPVAG